MNEYTASNGLTVAWLENGDQIGVTAKGGGGLEYKEWTGGKTTQALREFFRAEEDERLGRWRWPENPEWVVYPPVRDRAKIAVIHEGTGNSALYGRNSPTVTIRTEVPVSDWHRVARDYFDAHPERKPWERAEAGELWKVGFDGGADANMLAVRNDHGDIEFVSHNRRFAVTYSQINYATRIYPEGDS
jgi:hypothetical protein